MTASSYPPLGPLRSPSPPWAWADRGQNSLLDLVVVILGFVILPLDFPAAQPLRLPMTLCVLGYAGLHWRSLLPLLWQGRWVFMLPGYCFLSMLWADSPLSALRHGGLITFTMIFAGLVAARLDVRGITLALFLSQGGLALASLTSMAVTWVGGLDGGWAVVGIFPHKNVLGQRMLFLILSAVAIITTRGYASPLKLLAFGVVPLGLYLIALSLSATAVILLAGALPLALILALLWRPALDVEGARSLIVLSGMVVMSLGLLFLMNGLGVDPVDDVLGAFGKDRSLTGRTDIWAVANDAIAKHPLLGVGAGNFWQADNYAAARLASQFGVMGEQFYFHNLYYELMVHLGGLGLIIALYTYGRGVAMIVGDWWRRQRYAEPLFISLTSVFFIQSFTESELFNSLVLAPILFWVMVFSAIKSHGVARAESLAAIPPQKDLSPTENGY
ncbi:MAG: O-antigen ligase family protein [Pseudomonadota bacterium]